MLKSDFDAFVEFLAEEKMTMSVEKVKDGCELTFTSLEYPECWARSTGRSPVCPKSLVDNFLVPVAISWKEHNAKK